MIVMTEEPVVKRRLHPGISTFRTERPEMKKAGYVLQPYGQPITTLLDI
jgi:hypothetical protein